MDRVVTIDGREVGFKASALLPRLYRHKFGRDIMRDLNSLRNNFRKAQDVLSKEPPENEDEREAWEQERQNAQLSVVDLEIFENVAWLMAKQYDRTLPDSPEEWLDSIDGSFSIYEVMPVIMELWGMNQATTSVPKKK